MKSKTLEQYLSASIGRAQIDHCLRATRDASGKVTFYIRPLTGNGETLDFVVRDNALVLNETSESDVPDAVLEAAQNASAFSHDSDCSTNNRGVPERLGPCDCSADQAIGKPGIDAGTMASTSDDPKTIESTGAVEASASSYTYQRTDLDDAVSLIHGLAKLVGGAASLGATGRCAAMNDLDQLIKSTCAAAQKKLVAV